MSDAPAIHRPVPYRPLRPAPAASAATLARDLETARGRRSVRRFSPDPVPRELVERALEIAGTAPSGAHRQPWHFAVVGDPELKRRIREAAEAEERTFYERRAPAEWLEALAPLGTDFHKDYLEVAPWLVVVFRRDPEVLPDGRRLKNYYVQESVGIAVGFLVQALHRAGLATLTHTPSPMGFLRTLCGRPANEKPYVLMPVGYPAADCTVPDLARKPLREIASFLVLLAALAVPSVASAWGSLGHRTIAAHYGESLPAPLQALRNDDTWVVDHVMDPDLRKSSIPTEGYRHYIDIDAYPEYASGTLSHDRAVLEALHGAAQVQSWGIVPWAIGEVVDSMTVAMANGDWVKVRTWTADLCHYVGDMHQPLHCTKNYDGQYTGNNGIHARYETQMLNLYAQSLQLDAGTAVYLPDPVEAAFAIAEVSQQSAAAVLTADTEARAAAGGSTSSGTYYAGLWSRTSVLTLSRLTGGAVGTASFVYTAWVNAGSPPVPGSAVDAGSGPAPGLALAVGPVPARGSLVISFTLPGEGPVSCELLDVNGRRVARLDAGPRTAGPGRLDWTPVEPGGAALAPGVYFLRLFHQGRTAGARVVFTR